MRSVIFFKGNNGESDLSRCAASSFLQEQFVDFEKFIRELGNRPDIEHIFVVSSVPLMVLTPLMAHIAYIAEKVS